MTYAAEIRMVHASSVDHVPIHAYGVNLSLHFVIKYANDMVRPKYSKYIAMPFLTNSKKPNPIYKNPGSGPRPESRTPRGWRAGGHAQ